MSSIDVKDLKKLKILDKEGGSTPKLHCNVESSKGVVGGDHLLVSATRSRKKEKQQID